MELLSRHAAARMQQRGIRAQTLELLLQNGAAARAKDGASLMYFDKGAREQLLCERGRRAYRAIEGQLDAYAIVSGDGAVITVGHLYKRVIRH